MRALAVVAVWLPGTAESQAGRPVVLFIHGRDQAFRTGTELRAEWYSAFEDGLEKLGVAGLIGGSDRIFVRYEQYFEPSPPPNRCDSKSPTMAQTQFWGYMKEPNYGRWPEYPWSPLEDVGQRERLTPDVELLYREIDRLRNERDEARKQLLLALKTRADSEVAVRNLEEMEFVGLKDQVLYYMARAALRSIPNPTFVGTRFLEDTRAYIEQPRVAAAVHCELWLALDSLAAAQRPVVVVAHSMGALAVYRALSEYVAQRARFADTSRARSITVDRFISLGTQLGIPGMIRLLVRPLREPYPVPPLVRDWVNVRGVVDWVAPLPVRPVLQRPAGNAVRELAILTKPGNTHWIGGYLQHRLVAAAIAEGWCKSFRSPAAAPRGCGSVPAIAADVNEGQ